MLSLSKANGRALIHTQCLGGKPRASKDSQARWSLGHPSAQETRDAKPTGGRNVSVGPLGDKQGSLSSQSKNTNGKPGAGVTADTSWPPGKWRWLEFRTSRLDWMPYPNPISTGAETEEAFCAENPGVSSGFFFFIDKVSLSEFHFCSSSFER